MDRGETRRKKSVQALFIGQTYIDVTFLTDRMPTDDEKHVASAYAVSFGGNAVTAAFCCAKLSIVPDLVTSVADDWLGRMFLVAGRQPVGQECDVDIGLADEERLHG